MTLPRISLLTVLALALGACAAANRPPTGAAALPSPPGKDDCLWFRTLDDWSPIDRERLILWGPGRVPHLATLSFPATTLDFEFALAFQDRDNDGRICGHGFDAVILRDAMPHRINIAKLQRIEKADADKLLDAANPRRAKKRQLEKTPVPAGEAEKLPDAPR